MKVIISIVMLCSMLFVIGGCYSPPSREAFESVETAYRPGGEKPSLPVLSQDSPYSDFLIYAILNNPNVEAAFYDWKMSVEETVVAGSLPDPQLSISTEIASTVEKFIIGFMQEIPGPGKLELQARAASAEAQRKFLLFEEEMIHTAFKVHRTYYENAFLSEKIRLTNEMISIISMQEASVQTGIETGTVMANELSMLQAERRRLQVELTVMEDSRNVVSASWREALGIAPFQPLPPIPASAPDNRHAIADENAMLNIAMSHNIKLKALNEEIRQAETLVELAYKQNVPDFGAGLGTDTRQKPWSLMPELNLTLPVWRERINSQIAAARAGAEKSRSMLSAAELDLVIMLAEKSFMWRELNKQKELIETSLIPLTEIQISNLSIYYQTGSPGLAGWLNAERELLDLKIRLAEITARRGIVFADISCMVLSHQPEELVKIINPR